MKRLLYAILAVMTIGYYASAQTEPAHEWKVTLKVVDDDGQPVAGADVSVNYLTTRFVGLTDTNGTFTASHIDHSAQLAFHAGKSGYYSCWMQYLLGFHYDPAKWNQTTTLVLKKVGQPIPMYAKNVGTKTPGENEPIGFDLTVGDWVAPYGVGKISDLFFTVQRKITNMREYDAKLTLTFPNKGDGIAVAQPPAGMGSDFTTSRTASDSGYESERSWHYSNAETPESVFGYFIRIRTVLDQNGNVKSALYGKINGDISLYVGTKVPQSGIGFEYCLDPTPNDRNVEFDAKHNLLSGLKSFEEVKSP
jgi:hypothetical protein